MSRLPDPVDLAPADYLHAMQDRIEVFTELLDRLTVGADMPLLASVLSLHVGDLAKHITDAVENNAQGTNVVPHLLTSLDALATELQTLLERLARA